MAETALATIKIPKETHELLMRLAAEDEMLDEGDLVKHLIEEEDERRHVHPAEPNQVGARFRCTRKLCPEERARLTAHDLEEI